MENLFKGLITEDLQLKIEFINQLISSAETIEVFRACADLGKLLQNEFPTQDASFILKQVQSITEFKYQATEEDNLIFSKNLHESLVDLYKELLSQEDEMEESTPNDRIKKILMRQTINSIQMAKLGLESYFKLIRTRLDNFAEPDHFDDLEFFNLRKKISKHLETSSRKISKLIRELNLYKTHLELEKSNSDLLKQKQEITSEIILLLEKKNDTQQEIFNNFSNKIFEHEKTLSKRRTSHNSFFKPIIIKLQTFHLIDQLFKTKGELLIEKVRTTLAT